MPALEILAVVGIIGFVVFRQLQGEPLRGKRTVLLPAILTVIGYTDLRKEAGHLGGADVACLVVGVAGSACPSRRRRTARASWPARSAARATSATSATR